MNKQTLKHLIYLILGTGVLVGIDLWTKILAATHLKGNEALVLIPGVLELDYLENPGAAFGILRGQQWFFYIITILMLLVIFAVYFKMPTQKKYLSMRIILVFIVAGAIGNFIDRVAFQYVRDFIYFSLIDFPKFNVADSYITVGCILLFIMVVFVYKDEDFAFLSRKKKQEL